MSRTTHPSFHAKYAHRLNARPIDWRACYDVPDLDDDDEEEIDSEELVPRIEWTLFAPPRVPPTPPVEQLAACIDFDRLWPWTGNEASRRFPAYVCDQLRESLLDADERSALPIWLRPYATEGLSSVEMTRSGKAFRLWAVRTRLGVVVGTDWDLMYEIIPDLRSYAWDN